ncbi:hypothetical protein ElyMa_002188100 [Elysia marginata]|uniref:Uncharacterized protein n=1 Tax=Elysia marginata TaxID=1093978 RepID=A0AAV4FPM3_9GAST|nr:hypothetical protein ElyMa_002188100 [Elysia marginata]
MDSITFIQDSIINQIDSTREIYKILKDSLKSSESKLSKPKQRLDSVSVILEKLKTDIKTGKRKYRKVATLRLPQEKKVHENLLSIYKNATLKSEKDRKKLEEITLKYRMSQNALEEERIPGKIKKYSMKLASIDAQIRGENEKIAYIQGIINKKRERLEGLKEYIYLVKDSSYELYGKELGRKLRLLVQKRDEGLEIAKKYLLPKDIFEKTQHYNKRVEKGRSVMGLVALEFDQALSEIEKEYQEKEYKSILFPIIKKSIKKNVVKNVRLSDYNADKETFTVEFDCCGKTSLLEKGTAPPEVAKIIFKNPETIRGYVYSKYDRNCVYTIYYDGLLKHPYIKMPIKFATQEKVKN